MSYGHGVDLLAYEYKRRRRRERTARRASDYEERLGDGSVQIYFGHPCYCREAQIPNPWPSSFPGLPKERTSHEPHTFEYVHLTDDGPAWGRYVCDGAPMLLPVRK